jgi:hypothetical protein
MKIPNVILDNLRKEGSFAVFVLLCPINPTTFRWVISTPGVELADFIERNTAGPDEPIGLLLYTKTGHERQAKLRSLNALD